MLPPMSPHPQGLHISSPQTQPCILLSGTRHEADIKTTGCRASTWQCTPQRPSTAMHSPLHVSHTLLAFATLGVTRSCAPRTVQMLPRLTLEVVSGGLMRLGQPFM